MENNSKKYDLDAVVRGCVTIGVIAILYVLARRLSGVLVPFMVSWLIAYMMNPMVQRFEHGLHRLMPRAKSACRGIAVASSILLVLMAITAFILLIVPPMISEMAGLKELTTHFLTQFNYMDYIPTQWQEQIRQMVEELDFSALMANDDVRAGIQNILPIMWGWLTGGLSALTSLAVVAVSFLYIVFILLDYEELSEHWSDYLPARYRQMGVQLMSDLSEGMQSYFRGQAKVAALVGVMFAIGFRIEGLPLGIVMGLLIGVMNMVPYLQTVAVVPCLLLGVLQSVETGRPFWIIVVALLAIFVVVQSIQDMVLTPRIMGKVTGLHPAIILLSLSIWGSLLGVMGMIIALPMTTLMISYYRRYIAEGNQQV